MQGWDLWWLRKWEALNSGGGLKKKSQSRAVWLRRWPRWHRTHKTASNLESMSRRDSDWFCNFTAFAKKSRLSSQILLGHSLKFLKCDGLVQKNKTKHTAEMCTLFIVISNVLLELDSGLEICRHTNWAQPKGPKNTFCNTKKAFKMANRMTVTWNAIHIKLVS